VKNRLDLRDSASGRIRRESLDEVDGYSCASGAKDERKRESPERMCVDRLDQAIAEAIFLAQHRPKGNGDEPSKYADEQRTWQLAPPLFMGAKKVAHLAADHLRCRRGVSVVLVWRRFVGHRVSPFAGATGGCVGAL
jgi:hypothetical protein